MEVIGQLHALSHFPEERVPLPHWIELNWDKIKGKIVP
jgi:hypothetical protein